MPGLGRLVAPDIRDQNFPLRALLPPTPPKVTSRFYSGGAVLDQGDHPTCVAHAWKGWLDSAPIKDPQAKPPDSDSIYRWAQAIDEWASTPHDGTSVRAGAKVIQNLGRMNAYHWSANVDDARIYLLTTSTLVFGTNWYDSMWNTDASGFLKVSGSIVGGHAYLCLGYSQVKGAFRFCNSWGAGWGQHGRFWLSGESVTRLLNEDGECCAALELKA